MVGNELVGQPTVDLHLRRSRDGLKNKDKMRCIFIKIASWACGCLVGHVTK